MPVDENDVLRVSCRQVYAAISEVANVFHVDCLTNLSDDDQELGEDIAAWMSDCFNTVEALFPVDQDVNTIDIYNVTQDYPLGQFNWGAGYTGGTATGDPLPSGVAGLIIWNTNTKRMQGKTYLGVPMESLLTDGRWNATYLSAVTAFVDALMFPGATPSGSTFQFEIYSRTRGIVRHPTGFRTPLIPAYQKRRKFGRGS